MPTLEQKLMDLINSHGLDNESDTPDYILAQYLLACLAAFDTATQHREKHFGRKVPSL